ncbi:unnamed protein product [Nippostrongylus brasiliensis]|uniref:DUF3475 domain-containing protein n=1 Tax=Nippostrongylus brasiliensis TaxID=27835 RepID=A0A0N4XG99_NIPBR|nr:unnamed protein product [Nippostrongylus brasiliensis]
MVTVYEWKAVGAGGLWMKNGRSLALAIVGEAAIYAATYDIFEVFGAITILTKWDIIDRIKTAYDELRSPITRAELLWMNGPLHYKFQKFRAQLSKLSTDEQNVIGDLLLIAHEVLVRSVSDVEASDRIEEAFRSGPLELCAKFPRLDQDLCSPKARSTIRGGHPAPTGSSASSDENLEELIEALKRASSMSSAKFQHSFKDSLDEAQRSRPP